MESAEQTRWLSLPPRSWWALWLSAFVGWTAYGLLYAHQVMSMAADMGKQYAWADVLRTSLVGMWGWVPLAAGLAVVESLADSAGVSAGLKWPNDVIAGGGKLAGILAEVAPRGEAIVVGIGVPSALWVNFSTDVITARAKSAICWSRRSGLFPSRHQRRRRPPTTSPPTAP